MTPIKIVVIAVLLYLGYRLLKSDWRKKWNKKEESPHDIEDAGEVEDILVEDPICHKLVPRQQAIHYKSKKTDTVIYFCSEKCCDHYASQEGEKE